MTHLLLDGQALLVTDPTCLIKTRKILWAVQGDQNLLKSVWVARWFKICKQILGVTISGADHPGAKLPLPWQALRQSHMSQFKTVLSCAGHDSFETQIL